jgi:transmembrane sensor
MVDSKIIDEAAAWFVRLRCGKATATVHRGFMAWLRISPEHVRAYLGIVTLWANLPDIHSTPDLDTRALIARARVENNVVPLTGIPSIARATQIRASFKIRVSLPRPVLIAACVGLLTLAAGLFYWIQALGGLTYETALGERSAVELADGSAIQLDSHSRIRVRFSAKQRTVDLREGQALFSIANDPLRPFVVQSGTTRVRALGTRFDVYRNKAGTVVTVVEGRVTLYEDTLLPFISSHQRLVPELLSAGEQVTVARHVAGHPARADLAAVTSWTQGKLEFKSAPLSVVIDEFNRHNIRQLVRVGRVEDIPITAVFSATDLDTLCEFLKHQPELNVTTTQDEIVIRAAAPLRKSE